MMDDQFGIIDEGMRYGTGVGQTVAAGGMPVSGPTGYATSATIGNNNSMMYGGQPQQHHHHHNHQQQGPSRMGAPSQHGPPGGYEFAQSSTGTAAAGYTMTGPMMAAMSGNNGSAMVSGKSQFPAYQPAPQPSMQHAPVAAAAAPPPGIGMGMMMGSASSSSSPMNQQYSYNNNHSSMNMGLNNGSNNMNINPHAAPPSASNSSVYASAGNSSSSASNASAGNISYYAATIGQPMATSMQGVRPGAAGVYPRPIAALPPHPQPHLASSVPVNPPPPHAPQHSQYVQPQPQQQSQQQQHQHQHNQPPQQQSGLLHMSSFGQSLVQPLSHTNAHHHNHQQQQQQEQLQSDTMDMSNGVIGDAQFDAMRTEIKNINIAVKHMIKEAKHDIMQRVQQVSYRAAAFWGRVVDQNGTDIYEYIPSEEKSASMSSASAGKSAVVVELSSSKQAQQQHPPQRSHARLSSSSKGGAKDGRSGKYKDSAAGGPSLLSSTHNSRGMASASGSSTRQTARRGSGNGKRGSVVSFYDDVDHYDQDQEASGEYDQSDTDDGLAGSESASEDESRRSDGEYSDDGSRGGDSDDDNDDGEDRRYGDQYDDSSQSESEDDDRYRRSRRKHQHSHSSRPSSSLSTSSRQRQKQQQQQVHDKSRVSKSGRSSSSSGHVKHGSVQHNSGKRSTTSSRHSTSMASSSTAAAAAAAAAEMSSGRNRGGKRAKYTGKIHHLAKGTPVYLMRPFRDGYDEKGRRFSWIQTLVMDPNRGTETHWWIKAYDWQTKTWLVQEFRFRPYNSRESPSDSSSNTHVASGTHVSNATTTTVTTASTAGNSVQPPQPHASSGSMNNDSSNNAGKSGTTPHGSSSSSSVSRKPPSQPPATELSDS